jgi:hypothetical protein
MRVAHVQRVHLARITGVRCASAATAREADDLVIDLGDITTSRGTEMYLALWIRLMPATGSPMFNIKVVL